MVPKVILKHLETEPEKKKEIIEKIRKFYFKEKPINEETYPILINVHTNNMQTTVIFIYFNIIFLLLFF